jgi:transcriptional regulator with XRE-family HTH domain
METLAAERGGASPLALARLACGFSEEELAERAGIARDTISRRAARKWSGSATCY